MHMSKKQYLRALNEELQKLNGLIDLKILHDRDYKREALRHKRLLSEVRKQEVKNSFGSLTRLLTPSWF
jgi:hypothetical protein